MVTVATMQIAVIGCGARSPIAAHIARTGTAVVSALVDPRAEASRTLAISLGLDDSIPTYRSHQELLESGIRVDAALVLTPDDTHAQIAVDLLAAGVAVYLEKPLAIRTEDADAVLAEAERSGTYLYVGHNMRHMSMVKKMREVIISGAIGEVKAIWCRHFVGNGGDYYFKDWHAESARSNGLLLQKGAHDIDVIHWLAGGYTTRVVGMGGDTLYGSITDRRDNSDRTMPDWFNLENWPPLSQRDLNPVIDVEDLSMALMHLDNGVYASYQQCHYTPDYWRNYTVIGTEGRIENFNDSDGGVIRVWNKRTVYRSEGDLNFPIEGDAEGHEEADAAVIVEFVQAVTERQPTQTSPLAARYAVAAAAAATLSIRSGSMPVDVLPAIPELSAYFEQHQKSSTTPGASRRPATSEPINTTNQGGSRV